MTIKELIDVLSKCPNQNATIWVQTTREVWPIERIGPRWVLAEGKPYEEGDDDVRIVCKGMPFD